MRAVLTFMVQRKAGPGPFFQDKDGKALTRATFIDEVRKALNKAGMASHHITSHSFRIEAATAAARGGATDTEITAFGLWRSREYQGYIRRDSSMQAFMAGRLVGGPRAGSSKGQNLWLQSCLWCMNAFFMRCINVLLCDAKMCSSCDA